MTTLRAVAPRSLVIIITPVPRVGLSEQHLGAFDAASQMCSEVNTECGGHVLTVCDVVATPTCVLCQYTHAVSGNDTIKHT